MSVKRIHNEMWQKSGTCLGFLLVLSLLASCTVTESTFAKTTSNAGSAFAAAATTLTYAHDGKITFAYAASSYVNFQSELSGTDQTLNAQGGVNRRMVQHLLALYRPAMQVIDAPCLSSACGWQKQLEILNRASQEFLKAGNS